MGAAGEQEETRKGPCQESNAPRRTVTRAADAHGEAGPLRRRAAGAVGTAVPEQRRVEA